MAWENAASDPLEVELVYDRVRLLDKSLQFYEGQRHEFFNEPEHLQVLGEVANWLDVRLRVVKLVN
jgi:alpha-beta hydrolase superfamily lysophospholipase